MTNQSIKLNAWDINYESQIAVQGEVNSRTLSVTLIDRTGAESYISNAESVDRPVDLTGVSARLYILKSDGTKTFSDGKISDAPNGKVDFELPAQSTTAAGRADCQILLTKADNSSLKIVGLTLEVQPSNLEGAVESSDEFSALVVALNSIDASVAKVNQAVTNSEAAVNNANTAIAGANTAANNANDKAALANTAAATASTAASNADSKATLASTAASNANAATSAANTATTTANTAAGRANTAAKNAEDVIAGQLDPAIDSRIAAKTDITGGVAGYNTLTAHTSNADIHTTLTEKTAWDAKADKSTIVTATLTAANWTGEAPYTQTITVTGVTKTSVNEILPSSSITPDQLSTLQAANLQDGGQAVGSITVKAYGDKPTIDLPIQIIIRGDM